MSLVRVALLSVDASILIDVLKGIVHETPLTAMIAFSHCISACKQPTVNRGVARGVANSPEQSIRFCSERDTSFPVALKCCPSSDPVALKDQQDPHWPWEGEKGGVTAELNTIQCRALGQALQLIMNLQSAL